MEFRKKSLDEAKSAAVGAPGISQKTRTYANQIPPCAGDTAIEATSAASQNGHRRTSLLDDSYFDDSYFAPNYNVVSRSAASVTRTDALERIAAHHRSHSFHRTIKAAAHIGGFYG
jgi:hypothetical protein